ncbi:MAG: beta galactosidase jelly roll domain-containing protein, partial [Candidatus Hydrogenedentes bacterium]|nr:beta galactosidase jelly roll domain-containing protein [Candidatus Hydrogenedentota bacterium]
MNAVAIFFLCHAFLFSAQPEYIPADSWYIQSSAKLEQGGELLSMPDVNLEGWYPISVPKTVLAGLVDNGVYEDPYYGLNLKGIPGYQEGAWLIQKDDSPFRDPWWYRVEFDLPEQQDARVFTLHFEGINYEANIWLNGKKIADHETVVGMFRRFEFPVTDGLDYGKKNVLAVEIIPPGLLPDLEYKTKQVEATTGWDDHNPQPPDMNMGVWQPVYLHEQGEISIRHPYVESELTLPGLEQAKLTVSAWLRNNTHTRVSGVFSGVIEDRAFSQEITLEPDETREVFFHPDDFEGLVVDKPRVWWPNPVGTQEMYALELKVAVGNVLSDTAATDFGIREITSYINDEDWRGYRVNGRNILIRGGAWMTIDMLLNLDENLYDALVRHAREANLNMLRSEGFSIRELAPFYRLCDKYGIMVTQQIFGRNLPDEPLAIACIEDMMLRIRNHPSLAHFLGHDETFPTDTLNAAYEGLLKKHRMNRTYQPHSGTFNIVTRAKTGGTRTGTRELWTYAGPTHYYFVEKRKYDSAWGFAQSGGIGGILAARDSLRQMMPEDKLWPITDNETWSFHTVMQGTDYFDAIFNMMERKYGVPENFDDFCDKLYAMNYNSARGMYEAYARHKYKALGITTWKYNVAWPAALTWQYVDWYKRATAAYYGAKKACTPLHALYAHDDQGLYVTNSYYHSCDDLELLYALYDLDGSKVLEERVPVDVEQDGVLRVASVEAPEGISDPWFLKLELRDKAGTLCSENTYWLSHTPDIPGRSGSRDGIFKIAPKSVSNFTALASLPVVTLEVEMKEVAGQEEKTYTVLISNPGTHIAFMVEATLVDSKTHEAVAPTYW